MNQQQFKEALFENRETIKNKLAGVYNSKKLSYKLFAVLEKIDFNQFEKLSKNEQYEIVQKIFEAPELAFGNIARDEIKRTKGLSEKRKKSKEKKNG